MCDVHTTESERREPHVIDLEKSKDTL